MDLILSQSIKYIYVPIDTSSRNLKGLEPYTTQGFTFMKKGKGPP